MIVLKTLIKKELIQTLRDKKIRIVIFVMPVMQMIIFGFAITSEVKNLKISICDLDKSVYSRELISTLTRGEYFKVANYTESSKEALDDLFNNRSRISIIIPPSFEKKLRMGLNSEFQILIDGSDGNSANIAMGYILRMVQDSNLRATPKFSGVRLSGIFPQPFSQVSLEPRIRYNEQMESRFFLLPGILTMILTIIITLLTAMGITREKEAGTFEQLIVSPLKGWELILGKTLPFFLIGMIDLFLVTMVSLRVFQMPFNGSIFVFLLLNSTYILCMLGMGLFISTISNSQGQAMMTVFALLFPFIILSDFFFPIENMPIWIQYLTYINPIKYSLTAQREIFLKGNGLEVIYPNVLALAGFFIFFLSYGAFRFRKSLA